MKLYDNPGVCPKCETEATYNAPELAAPYQYVRCCRCSHCGCTWSELYVFERKRVDTESMSVRVFDDHGRVSTYTVGEVFRHDGETFYCTTDGKGIVRYCQIDEPIDDMMFRASDGKLYQFIKDVAPYRERICACRVSELRCNDIQQLLFGRDCADGEFWLPVDEGK